MQIEGGYLSKSKGKDEMSCLGVLLIEAKQCKGRGSEVRLARTLSW